MCRGLNKGDFEVLSLWSSHHGFRLWKVDRCIADLLRYLNRRGCLTFASCCMHGKEAFASVAIPAYNGIAALRLGASEVFHDEGVTTALFYYGDEWENQITDEDRSWRPLI